MLTIIVFRGFFACVVDLQLHMTNKALFLLWQWKGVLLNCLIHVPMTRFLHYTECSDSPFSNIYVKTLISFFQMQGPFDTFLVGGDTAEVCDIKFSNDGKSMLLTTTNNNIYVLDAYGGEKVDHTNLQIFFFNLCHKFVSLLVLYLWYIDFVCFNFSIFPLCSVVGSVWNHLQRQI